MVSPLVVPSGPPIHAGHLLFRIRLDDDALIYPYRKVPIDLTRIIPVKSDTDKNRNQVYVVYAIPEESLFYFPFDGQATIQLNKIPTRVMGWAVRMIDITFSEIHL